MTGIDTLQIDIIIVQIITVVDIDHLIEEEVQIVIRKEMSQRNVADIVVAVAVGVVNLEVEARVISQTDHHHPQQIRLVRPLRQLPLSHLDHLKVLLRNKLSFLI